MPSGVQEPERRLVLVCRAPAHVMLGRSLPAVLGLAPFGVSGRKEGKGSFGFAQMWAQVMERKHIAGIGQLWFASQVCNVWCPSGPQLPHL